MNTHLHELERELANESQLDPAMHDVLDQLTQWSNQPVPLIDAAQQRRRLLEGLEPQKRTSGPVHWLREMTWRRAAVIPLIAVLLCAPTAALATTDTAIGRAIQKAARTVGIPQQWLPQPSAASDNAALDARDAAGVVDVRDIDSESTSGSSPTDRIDQLLDEAQRARANDTAQRSAPSTGTGAGTIAEEDIAVNDPSSDETDDVVVAPEPGTTSGDDAATDPVGDDPAPTSQTEDVGEADDDPPPPAEDSSGSGAEDDPPPVVEDP